MHLKRPSVIRLDWRDRRRSFFECRMLHGVAIGAGASDGAPPMMMSFPLPSEEPSQCRSRMRGWPGLRARAITNQLQLIRV